MTTIETTAGRAVVEVLLEHGVSCVFGLPGGHVLDIYEGLYEHPEITHVLVRHEHTAAAMAAGYAQLTGEPAVVLVTAGPGATNLVTAVAEAYVGSLPMVIFAGRGATATVHRGASQEVATDQIFAPVTKWAVRVDRADLVADVVRQAFAIATSGRPGPVLVDLPRDILGEQVSVTSRPVLDLKAAGGADPDAITRAADALAGAARPLLVAGGGAVMSGAFAEIRQLAERLEAPVLTSLAGRGSIPDDHRLSFGGLGAHRTRVSKRLLAEADVVLGLGTRFEEMETNWHPGAVPGPDARYLQVDVEGAEIGRSVPAHVGLVGDVRAVVQQLLDELSTGDHPTPAGRTEWVAQATAELADLDAQIAAVAAEEHHPVHPLTVFRTAREEFPRNTTVALDVGCLAQHMAGGSPYFRVFEPRSLIVPSSFYGMGFSAAALPVARLVYPGRAALGFVGDGSFQMVMTVLPVAAEQRLGVTWIVLNDNALGSIWDIQRHKYDNRIIDTAFAFQPDFTKIAEACGCYGERVEKAGDLAAAMRRAIEHNGRGIPAVLDVAVERARVLGTREHYSYYPAADDGEL